MKKKVRGTIAWVLTVATILQVLPVHSYSLAETLENRNELIATGSNAIKATPSEAELEEDDIEIRYSTADNASPSDATPSNATPSNAMATSSNADKQQFIKLWNWENFDEEYFQISSKENNPIFLDNIVQKLPRNIEAITFTDADLSDYIFDEEDIYEMEENAKYTIPISEWVCDEFPEDGAYKGDYVFQAILGDEKFVLDEPAELVVEVSNDYISMIESLINDLPSLDEVENTIESLEDNEEELTLYYTELQMKCQTIYAYYLELPDNAKGLVFNYDQFELYSFMLAEIIAIELDSPQTICQINSYSQAVPTMIYGGTVQSKLGSRMGFAYWTAIVVEEEDGLLRVSTVDTSTKSKLSYGASTSKGFVLLIFGNSASVSVGDYVSTSVPYTKYSSGSAAYDSSGYGTITISEDTPAQEKPEKNNSQYLTITPTSDTHNVIQVNLYDYSTNINNKYKGNNKYPGFQQGGGTRSVGTSISTNGLNYGDNIVTDLGAGFLTVGNNGGAINAIANGANRSITGAIYPELINGYPALADGTSLSYLFSSNEYAKKINTDNVNYLFQYDEETGKYSFDSSKNAAIFDKDTDTFTVYDQLITPNYTMYPFGNFMPFSDIVHDAARVSDIDRDYLKAIADNAAIKHSNGESTVNNEYNTLSTCLSKTISLFDNYYGSQDYTIADWANYYFNSMSSLPNIDFNNEDTDNIYCVDFDEPKNFFFGMEMKMEFIQPRNGMAGPHGDQEMEFAFAGDDDIWVFVDGKLFLDLSGIHRHCGGTINFKEGTVSYFDFDPDIGDVSPDPYKVVPFEDVLGTTDGLFYDNNKGEYTTFKTFSTHKFEFYYMERGAGSGMCRMYFNMPLREENSMAVTKYLEVDDGDIEELLGDQEFAFQILNAGTETPYITEGITYTIQDAYGNEVCKKQTEPNGLFRVKATQTAVFSELESSDESYYVRELIRDDFQSQYGKVEVNGDIKTSYSYVTLDDEAFVGFESNEKNLADGNSSFAFANHVIKEKTGKLIITKELKNSDSKTDEFMVEIKFDGTPIQKGYIYHLTQCDGTSVIRTVTDEGIVIIKPGESILLENILLGSEFTVQEVGSYVDGYSISYHGDCTETILNDYEAAKGQMLASETLQVDIVNAESSGKILIQKDIPADQIYKTADGTVVGLFKISGTDLRGNKHTYVREVRMDSIDGDVASGTAVIESVPFGTYTVQEIETGRYKQSGLAVNDSSNMTVSMSSSQKKITVKSDSIRRKYNGFAHACIVKNSIKK